MQFAALNKELSASVLKPRASAKKTTQEAQESGCLQRYHEAIKLQQDGDMGGARALYREILGAKVIDKADGGMMLRLKFLIYKNLGSIARSHGDDSAALDAFIQAVSVDDSDVTVWYQLSQASCNLGNLLLGRRALEEARKCQAQFWPATDLLCCVLFALEDYGACLQLINITLEHCPQFPRGLAYLHHIADKSPELLTFMPSLRLHLMKPRPPDTDQFIKEATALSRRRGLLAEVKVLDESITPPKTMAYYSLYSLGQCLVSTYNHCQERSRTSPSLATPVDLQLLCDGTSDIPLLPRSPEVVDIAGSSERGGEGGRREGEGGRKRSTPDLTEYLMPKRRSSRVKFKREQTSISERVAQFLPDSLRGCEFGDVCALSPLLSSGPPLMSLTDQSDGSVVDSAPCLSDVVKAFLGEHENNSGIISLIYSYLLLLALHYNWRWAEASFPVVRMFLELYELVQPHLTFPSPLCSAGDPEYTSLQDMAMICLCYSEVKVDCLQRSSSRDPLPQSLSHAISFCQLVCTGTEGCGWRGRSEFTLRVFWCVYKLKTVQMDMCGAFAALQKCSILLESSHCDHPVMPNLRQDGQITPDCVSSKLKSLERTISCDKVYSLYQSGDHTTVVTRLRPLLEWKSDNYSQFLMGGDHANEKPAPLSLLLSSLLSLDRRQECVECCVLALTELLICYKLGNERWVSVLHNTYTQLNRCLSEGGVELLRLCGARIRRHLLVCVFKTLDLQVEMTDSSLLPLMPLCLPWSVLHTTLLCVWGVAMETSTDDVAMETEPTPADMVTDDEAAIPTTNQANEEDYTPNTMTMATRDQMELHFLSVAHECLGVSGQGWCVRDGGCFLKTAVVRLRDELRVITAHTPETRETLLRELEQCYYCLYGHPHRKAKVWGLQDHGAEQLPLTWESAQVLLEFYHPSFLPAVEENKTLTPELLVLYRRIVDVIPDTGRVVPLSVIAGYIESRVESLPLPSSPSPHTAIISEIFYLLADDALKSSEYMTAVHNYIQSICYCPERVDTWAGLALARARSIMKKLDRRDVRCGVEGLLQKQVTPTLRCFKRALALGSQHHYISEKYGLFCYTVQSHCSQILSQSELYKEEVVAWARRSRCGLLQLARQCFNSALSNEGVVRVWPWYYSLIAAKAGLKLRLPPSATLPVLIKAARQLCSDEATPPATVELRGQWMTSVEMYYQIYSCALKYLLHDREDGGRGERGEDVGRGEDGGRERGEDVGMGEDGERGEIEAIIANCQGLPLGTVEYREVRQWVRTLLNGADHSDEEETPSRYGTAHSDGLDAVSLFIKKVISDAEREVALETAMETTPPSVLEQCLYGVAVCSVKCPAYYKSLYRLASTLHTLGQSQVSKKLLLGPLPGPLLRAQDKLLPLFILKPNIFANVWQIPVEEINRPGRFSSSASSSVQLLCEVLSQQLDSTSLILLVQHLRSRPEASRQYLRDYERVAMCQKAIQCCTSVHAAVMKDTSSCSIEKLMMEMFSLRNLAQKTDDKKHTLTKAVEANLLNCYQLALEGGVVSTGGGSTIEEAVKYCQTYTSKMRIAADK